MVISKEDTHAPTNIKYASSILDGARDPKVVNNTDKDREPTKLSNTFTDMIPG